jgi:hypothetical protein
MFCSTRFLCLYYHHLHHKFSCFAGDHGFCWYGFSWNNYVVSVTLPGVCCASRWDVYKAATGNWRFRQHVCVWLCWLPCQWCQVQEGMPRVCYQQYVPNSQKGKDMLQRLPYLHWIHFVTDCFYHSLFMYLIRNFIMQWSLNNDFTLLKFASLKTLYVLGPESTEKGSSILYFSQTNQHCQKTSKISTANLKGVLKGFGWTHIQGFKFYWIRCCVW